jgi:DNA invertase Pin-like site-specific DNA recombinase
MTLPRPTRAEIVAFYDTVPDPAVVARALGVSVGTVYAALRAERPDRQRKARPRTSDLPYRIRGLAANGIKPRRIAELLEVSRTYTYRVLQVPPLPPPPY